MEDWKNGLTASGKAATPSPFAVGTAGSKAHPRRKPVFAAAVDTAQEKVAIPSGRPYQSGSASSASKSSRLSRMPSIKRSMAASRVDVPLKELKQSNRKRQRLANEASQGEEEDEHYEEDGNVVSAAQAFLERSPEIEERAAEAIITLPDVSVPTPRGRYDITLHADHLCLHGKTYDHKIPYEHIHRMFLLPRPDAMFQQLIVGLDSPLEQGQTSYPWLVLQWPDEEEINITLNIDDDELNRSYPGLKKDCPQQTYIVVGQLIRKLSGRKVVDDTTFRTATNNGRDTAVKASVKAEQGYLHFLEKSMLFVAKQPILIDYNQIRQAFCSRIPGTFRTCSIIIRLNSDVEHTFTSIDKEDIPAIKSYLRDRNVTVMSPSDASDIRGSDEMDLSSEDDEIERRPARGVVVARRGASGDVDDDSEAGDGISPPDSSEEENDAEDEENEHDDSKDDIKPILSELPPFLSQIAKEVSQSSRNAKRGSSDRDIKPKLEQLEPEVPHVPGPFSKLSNEAIVEIAHCLIDQDAYASATALVGMYKRTRQLLRPIMKKAKQKVVLDLDDLKWSDKKTWKDILIITCTPESALPIRADDFLKKNGQRTLRHDLSDLRPWAIVQKGSPNDGVLRLQEHAFPSAKIIRCNTNTAIDELAYLSVENPAESSRVEWLVIQTNNIIRALHNRSLANRIGLPVLRLKYHDDYAFGLRQTRPGQMFIRWTVTESTGYVVVEKESCAMTQLDNMQDDFKNWLRDITEHSLPFDATTAFFETISLDLYFQPRASTTGLFYSVDDEFPPAYEVLSEYAEVAAEKWLEASSLKPIADFKLRLFVLHGEFIEREKMKPVFRTHRAKTFNGTVKVRELYIDDDDFARCVEKGGCSRCKPSIKR